MGECHEISDICIAVICVTTPCRILVGEFRRFGGTYSISRVGYRGLVLTLECLLIVMGLCTARLDTEMSALAYASSLFIYIYI
jgi:hypothetical protein